MKRNHNTMPLRLTSQHVSIESLILGGNPLHIRLAAAPYLLVILPYQPMVVLKATMLHNIFEEPPSSRVGKHAWQTEPPMLNKSVYALLLQRQHPELSIGRRGLWLHRQQERSCLRRSQRGARKRLNEQRKSPRKPRKRRLRSTPG